VISIDGQPGEDVPLVHVWSECAGAGRANEALRADWQRQFTEAVDVLGFKYVRFHGLFHDDMFVYRESYGGGFGPNTPLEAPVHTFSYVDKVFDFILDNGARPFVELGFMPSELATQTGTVFWWGAHCSPPKDMARWVELVTATVEHWIGRYGIDEVRQWPFEVWNEPNLVPHSRGSMPGFASAGPRRASSCPTTGTRARSRTVRRSTRPPRRPTSTPSTGVRCGSRSS
jgi:xylan 1,4-beta-xylosidase